MKAVIVDLRDGQAAALCDDGRVIKLAATGYSLGQIVEVHERKHHTPRWVRWASTAAAAALLLAGAGGGAAWAMPYGVVSLDVNPSLEYTINRFDYVLKVEGVNEDGQEMLSRMDTSQLLHRPIGKALEASVQQLEDGEWLGGESNEILISAGTKQPSHAEKLVQALEEDLGTRRESLEVHGVAVSEAEIDEAHREGMSAGRHRVLGELRESEGEDFAFNEWADRPIRDIFHRLEAGPKGAPELQDAQDAHSTQSGPRQDAREDTRPATGGASTDVQPQEQQSQQRPVPQQSEPQHGKEQQQAEPQNRESQQTDRPQNGQLNEQPQTVPGESPQDGGAVPSRPDNGGFGAMPGDGGHGAGGPGGGTGGPRG